MRKVILFVGLIIVGFLSTIHIYYDVLWTKKSVADWKMRSLHVVDIICEQEKRGPITKEFIDSVETKWKVNNPCLPIGVF